MFTQLVAFKRESCCYGNTFDEPMGRQVGRRCERAESGEGLEAPAERPLVGRRVESAEAQPAYTANEKNIFGGASAAV